MLHHEGVFYWYGENKDGPTYTAFSLRCLSRAPSTQGRPWPSPLTAHEHLSYLQACTLPQPVCTDQFALLQLLLARACHARPVESKSCCQLSTNVGTDFLHLQRLARACGRHRHLMLLQQGPCDVEK